MNFIQVIPIKTFCVCIPLFYVRFRLPHLYLTNMSPNFLIVFCIKSLMLDLKNYIQIPHDLSCVRLFVNLILRFAHLLERPVPRRHRDPEGLRQVWRLNKGHQSRLVFTHFSFFFLSILYFLRQR